METTRGGPMAKGAFMVKLQELGTRRSADAIVKQMLHAGKLDITRQRGRNGCKLIGTPEQIQQLEEQHETN